MAKILIARKSTKMLIKTYRSYGYIEPIGGKRVNGKVWGGIGRLGLMDESMI